ncbi:unnamed protein product [Pocillopora meandrina]|uniref:Uncharacterized protein n=1 Tax=Pocillopora meandrina TaxID=46732 RepID=A0AAU9WIZ0_9CNID|nr:unnamed protein product [Pocillopora meandrina]
MEWQLGQSSINQFLFVYCVYVVYACDAQTNCIKILTSLKQTAEFFNALGEIYKAFSVHERHLAYRLPSIQEAVGLVSDTLQLLHRNETSIRGEVANLPKTLNGPHFHVASKTVVSVELRCLEYALKTSRKDPLCTELNYATNFGNAAEEGLKRTTHWATYYLWQPYQ